MKCFYHNDLDGHCAGAIIKLKYPECEMYPINYGQSFPFEDIEPLETIYMVDFCLQPFDLMENLADISDLRWFDHHKTAIGRGKNFVCSKKALVNGKAGCEITWEQLMDKPLPEWVYYIGRFDVWDHNNPNVLPFHYGCLARETDPSISMEFWKDLDNYDSSIEKNIIVDIVLRDGLGIQQYQTKKYIRYCETAAFDLRWEGLTFLAANSIMTGPLLFDRAWDPIKYDAMLTFGWRAKGYWTIGLYTEKPNIDVSKIAEKHGGGGHAGASGFQCEELPFRL